MSRTAAKAPTETIGPQRLTAAGTNSVEAPMARPPLEASVKLLSEHFGGPNGFYLPWFQRAYAWDEEHAARLLSDIWQAMTQGQSHYYLGRVLLAGPPGKSTLALVDGHQRTLTLTILFALLRDRAPAPAWKARLQGMIAATEPWQTGEEGIVSNWRLATQSAIAPFVEGFLQADQATDRDIADTDNPPTEIETTILDNRNRLKALLDQLVRAETDWHRLAEFLLNRCYLVVEYIPDEEQAWAMLALEETTGLPFHSAERLKVSLISAIPRARQQEASVKWENWQSQLGADDMHRLLHHVRSLVVGYRSTKPIEQDLIRTISKAGAYEPLFDGHIDPAVKQYLAIREHKVSAWPLRRPISRLIRQMQWLERDFWVAPALKWLITNGASHPETLRFFTHLERMSWLLRISSNDPVQHERDFLRMCREIEPGNTVDAIPTLRVGDALREATLSNLLSKNFFEKRYSRLILRRISAELGLDSGDIDGVRATIEHVLPRNPPPTSPWRKAFRGENAIKDHMHRLGNLAILSLEHNQEAGVQPYSAKRKILKRSNFSLARDAASLSDWTPSTIERRSRALVNLLFEAWRLPKC
jgi:hypothetical protein